MGMSDSENENQSTRRVKVARLLDEYELGGLGEQMEQRWTADGDDRMSLRDLADHFNQELLRSALTDAGQQPLAGEVENTYQLLTGEETSEADRTRVKRRLEREGIDVDELQRDFVTYQAIRTYLKEYRDATYESDDRDRAVVEMENLQRLRGRTLTVTDSILDRLKRNTEFELGEFRVFAEISVLCEDCGVQYNVEELLERGGCDCGEAPE
jgi:hypothetical protein